MNLYKLQHVSLTLLWKTWEYINKQVLMSLQQDLPKQEENLFILRSMSTLILLAIRKNSLRSERCLLFYLFLQSVIKLIVLNGELYHCYQPRAKCIRHSSASVISTCKRNYCWFGRNSLGSNQRLYIHQTVEKNGNPIGHYSRFNVVCTVHEVSMWDTTLLMNDLYYPLFGSTCFGLSPVHHQEHHLLYCVTQFGTIVLPGEASCCNS